MTFEVRIPQLGESVSEGTIVRGRKEDGGRGAPDEILLELETDKATLELPAERGGVVRHVRKAGDTVAVGDVVARIEDGAGAAVRPSAAPAGAAAAPAASRPAETASPRPAPSA